MKKMIFILSSFLFVMATQVFASDCDFVCQRIQNPGSSHYRSTCFSVVRNNYVQYGACSICDKVSTAAGTVDCMETIANRRYNSSELETCRTFNGLISPSFCLAFSGNDYYGPKKQSQSTATAVRCDTDKLYRQSEGVISNYNSGNVTAMISTLKNMKTGLNACNSSSYSRTSCDTQKLSRQVDGAISNYNSGNTDAFINTIRNVNRSLDSCH